MKFLSSLIIGVTITVASSAITTSQSTPLSRSPFRQNVKKQKPTVGREPYCPSKEERGQFCPEREPKVSEAHGCTQLMRAAESGRLGEVRELLVSKVNVPAKFRDGDQALMLAAAEGHLVIVKVLLAADADPNAIFATNHDLGTAWMAAMNRCNKNWLEILDAMIAAGVKVNPKSDIYFSPLGYAISKQKDTAMIEELLKRG